MADPKLQTLKVFKTFKVSYPAISPVFDRNNLKTFKVSYPAISPVFDGNELESRSTRLLGFFPLNFPFEGFNLPRNFVEIFGLHC